MTYILEELLDQEVVERIVRNMPKEYSLEEKRTKLRKEESREEKSDLAASQLKEEESVLVKQPEVVEIESLEEYIFYYELIRQAIRRNIDRYYTRPTQEGEIHVIFGIEKNGSLKKISINKVKSSRSKLLERIALKSVRAASPFPPFPEVLRKDELTFTVSIVFTKN